MTWSRCRRAAGLYFVLFFLAVTAAPHHHLNDLEDLLLDQKSDSGVVVLPSAIGAPAAEAFRSCRVVRDVPCLGCFTRDFVSVPTSAFTLVAVFARLPLRPEPPAIAAPQLLPADTSSRAPPLSS